jgi:hypothetical protein
LGGKNPGATVSFHHPIVDRKVNFSWSNHVTLEKTHIAMENDRFVDDLPEHNDFSWQGITFPEGTG